MRSEIPAEEEPLVRVPLSSVGRMPHAVESRLVEGGPVPESLEVGGARVDGVTGRATLTAIRCERAGCESETKRRSPDLGLVVDWNAECRMPNAECPPRPSSLTHIPSVRSAITSPTPTVPLAIFFWRLPDGRR